MYFLHYYKYHYFGAYGKFKHLLSCKTYGVDWCRNIINLLSKLNDKIQEAKDENEIIYKAWKRIESLFMDDVANFNNFLLEKDETSEDMNSDKFEKLYNAIFNSRELTKIGTLIFNKNAVNIIKNIDSRLSKKYKHK